MHLKTFKILPILLTICCTHNYEPVINSIVADPNPVEAGGTVTLLCDAKDDDTSSSVKDEELTYEWIAAIGDILVGENTQSATWVSPPEPGFYSITCKVADQYNGKDIETISVEVK
jgi:hypothetical protein